MLNDELYQFKKAITSIAICAVNIPGVFANILLIVILLRYRNIPKIPNKNYLISLASSGLLLALASLPFILWQFYANEFPFGTFICKLSNYTNVFCDGVTTFTLVILSAESYCNVRNSLRKITDQSDEQQSTRRSAILVGITWIVSALLAVPTLFSTQLHQFYDSAFCMQDSPLQSSIWDPRISPTTTVFVYYVVPLILMVMFQVLVVWQLISSYSLLSKVADVNRKQILEQYQSAKIISRTVLALVGAFAIFFFAINLLTVWYNLLDFEYTSDLRIVSTGLWLSYSPVLVISLYIISRDLRKYLVKYICCRTFRSNKELSSEILLTTNNVAEQAEEQTIPFA